MTPETVTIYHSTDRLGLERAQSVGKLFGQELLNPNDGYSGGANLTTSKAASQEFIIAYRGSGQWTGAEGPPNLVTLTFDIPIDLAKHVGKTHLLDCPEYATTVTVDARDIPDVYFENFHAGRCPITKERAIIDQDRGRVRFYQVPFEWLTATEKVDYKYRGVCY